MKFKFRYLDQIVGVFIVAFLLALVAAVLAVGRGKGWFTEYRYYLLSSRAAGGVAIGTAVLLENQMAVGNVLTIEMAESNEVLIRIKVKADYANRIRTDSKAVIRSDPLSGSKVFITIGDPNLPEMPEDVRINTSNEGGLFEQIPETMQSAKETLQVMKETFRHLREDLKKVDRVLDVLQDEEHGLRPTLRAYRSLAYDLHQGEGFFARMVNDTDLYPQLRTGMGRADALLIDAQAAGADIRKFTARLDPLADRLEKTVGEITGMSGQVARAVHRAGPLLDEAEDTLGEMRGVMRGVRGSWLFESDGTTQPPAATPTGGRDGAP